MKDLSSKKIRMVIATSVPSTMASFGKGQMTFFKRHGFDVDYLASSGDGLETVLKEEVNYFETDFRRTLSPIADIKTLCKLVKLFRHRKPAVVQLMTLKPSILGVLAGRISRVPLLLRHKWGYMRDCNYRGVKRFLLFSADKWSNRLAHRVVINSHELKDAEIAIGAVNPEKVAVYGAGTSHGIDLERYTLSPELKEIGKKIRCQFNLTADDTVLGTVMRVNIEKGICELVEAFSQLHSKYNNLHLMIVGDYDPRNCPPEKIARMIEDHPNIHMAGWQKDVNHYYAAMDIFVLPTYREGFCNSNIEASAMELPVVSTKIIGVDGSSVVNGITGLIVPPRNSIELARAINEILNNKTFAKQLAANGRKRVEEEFPNELIWHYQLKDICQLLSERGIKPPVESEKIVGRICPLCNNPKDRK
ncbi:MAG: glycosyltransferase family 4 protein [Phycisphaerae bacterium]|nr:glycosyltransferase family 4 protein [Phycisphaerae bacterium]